MLSGLVSLVIWLIVLGVFFYIVNWALSQFSLPEPFPMLIRMAVVIVILIVALDLLVSLVGYPGGRLLRL